MEKQGVVGTECTPQDDLVNRANKKKQTQTDCPHSFLKLTHFFNRSAAHQPKHHIYPPRTQELTESLVCEALLPTSQNNICSSASNSLN